jgi:uncharacterized protein
MNRVLKVMSEILKVINMQDTAVQRDETLDWERVHMASTARIAWILALQRGENPEISAVAAAVHDYGRIITGRQINHAEAGYLPVQSFLKSTGLFNSEEIRIVAEAAKNHSSKTVIGTPVEEIVKDADVIDCYQYGLPFDRPEKKTRYDAWLSSLTS